jgi:stress-induced-phosphoprotein 1
MSSPVKEESNEYAEYAARLKDQGNEAFKQGNIPQSITFYTQAIDMDPDNHVYYSNRSAGKI